MRTRSSWRCTVTTSSTSAPESTRPGAAPVAEAEVLARIEPVLADLARALDVPVSVDTYKSTVAARAVELGAVMVNDVWGLQKDPGMADAVAAAEAAVVIMHNLVERYVSRHPGYPAILCTFTRARREGRQCAITHHP